MKALVLGGGGQVGRAVAKALPAGHGLVIKTRAEVDIADEHALARLLAEAKVEPERRLIAARIAQIDAG